MRDVLREEKKFLLNQAEALKLRNYLSNVVHTDSHNGPDGYQVRSLYFDSLSNRDFQEKEDGLELRRKFRLRVYSPDADFALFEMKQKQGPYQRKRSLRLSRREAQALIEGDYSVLLNSGSEFGQECYSIMEMWAYRPKTVVEYDRFAFIAPENSIRITFDSGIRANEVNFNIFDRNLVLNSVMSPFAVVLEVKYNVTGFNEGRPLFVRKPDSKFNLANFMRVHLYTSLGALKTGMNILLKKEHVALDRMMGHGGLFKTKGVGQRILAGAIDTPVYVMETAGEGGAWGIALLADYLVKKEDKESLTDYLENKVFHDAVGTGMDPVAEDVEGYEKFMETYAKGLAIEKAAVENL